MLEHSKKISKNRSLTLPKELCQRIGMHGGQGVSLSIEGDSIKIKPACDVCSLCGSPQDVARVCGIKICKKCANEISKKFKSSEE